MTDRISSLTVIFDKDIREDDVERYIRAMYLFRHVLKVEKNLTDPNDFIYSERAKHKLKMKIGELLR